MADLESALDPSVFFYVDELMGLMSTAPISDNEPDRQSISEDNIDISEYFRADMFFAPFTRALISALPDQSNVDSDEVLKVVDADDKSRAEHCAVCLEKLFGEERKEVVKETRCGHRYHAKCIEQWLNMSGSCPLCRYKMPRRLNEDEEAIRRRDDDEFGVMQIEDDHSYDYWTVEYLLYLFRDW